MKTVVIGMGNTVLTDDGVGVYTVRNLSGCSRRADVEIIETDAVGMNLMEMLAGFERAIIVDAIQLDGEDPGTIFRLRPDDLRTTPRLSSSHDIDIVTALELGRRLGLEMPEEVLIFAVQAADMKTLSEDCTSRVRDVIPELCGEIESVLEGGEPGKVSIPLAQRRNRDA